MLRQVCQSWRDLIDSEPYLWNAIAFIMGDHRSMRSGTMFLRYSQTATIHIYGHGGWSRLDGHTWRLANELKRKLQAASNRIASFYIIKPNSSLLRLWPATAPSLERLVISTSTAFPPAFSGEMPLLRSVATPVTNHHQFLITHHLTSLTLYPPYTLEELLSTLGNAPHLQKLELRGVFESAHNDHPQIPLPHLEHLFLTDCYHEITDFIDIPAHTNIIVSVPDHLNNGVSWRDIDVLSTVFIPPTFLRSSNLTIVTNEVRRPSEVRFVGRNEHHHYYVYIDLKGGSSSEHRRSVCLYAMGMVRSMTTVSSLHLHSKVPFPAKCTLLLRRLHNLKILEISGPFMCPVLKALEDDNLVPSLERISVERQYLSLYRAYRDEIISLRQADGGQLRADI